MREDGVGERLESWTKRVGHKEELGGGQRPTWQEKNHVRGPTPYHYALRCPLPPSLACNPHGSRPSSRFFFSFLNPFSVPALKFRLGLVLNSGPMSVPSICLFKTTPTPTRHPRITVRSEW